MNATVSIVVALIIALCVAAEFVWSRRRGQRVYDLWETISNASMMVVGRSLKPIALAWSYFVLSLLEPLQLLRLPDSAWAVVVTFVVTDLAYYGYHRASHEVPFLWAMHHTHHSSPWMNLSTAVRLNWVAKFVNPLFFAPLVLLGMSPTVVAASQALGLLFQFFLHTEYVGRLGWFEGKLLNTPSAHRVHHGSNPQYIDKNYAGVFVVWDRLFGTYEPEQEAVQYGVTSGFLGHNPLVAQFRPLWQYFRGKWSTERATSVALIVLVVTTLGFAAPGSEAFGAQLGRSAFDGVWHLAAEPRVLQLAPREDRLELTRDGRTVSHRVDAKRDRIEVSIERERGKVLTTYTLSPDGTRLTMSVRMTSERLRSPVVYASTYRRP